MKTRKEASRAEIFNTIHNGDRSMDINSGTGVQDIPEVSQTAKDIAEVCDSIRDMLIGKNRAYGDSALTPVRIFSRASLVEQIRVRLDDKLSRLARGAGGDYVEDVEGDIIGYLILLRIAKKRAGSSLLESRAPVTVQS